MVLLPLLRRMGTLLPQTRATPILIFLGKPMI
jgi:hypothetical protein